MYAYVWIVPRRDDKRALATTGLYQSAKAEKWASGISTGSTKDCAMAMHSLSFSVKEGNVHNSKFMDSCLRLHAPIMTQSFSDSNDSSRSHVSANLAPAPVLARSEEAWEIVGFKNKAW